MDACGFACWPIHRRLKPSTTFAASPDAWKPGIVSPHRLAEQFALCVSSGSRNPPAPARSPPGPPPHPRSRYCQTRGVAVVVAGPSDPLSGSAAPLALSTTCSSQRIPGPTVGSRCTLNWAGVTWIRHDIQSTGPFGHKVRSRPVVARSVSTLGSKSQGADAHELLHAADLLPVTALIILAPQADDGTYEAIQFWQPSCSKQTANMSEVARDILSGDTGAPHMQGGSSLP